MKNKFLFSLAIFTFSVLLMTCTSIPKIQQGDDVFKISSTKIELKNGESLKMSKSSDTEKTTIILVRHAEKIKGVKDPELTKEGIARSEKLKSVLSDIKLNKVFSTDTKRTQQTASPTATSQSKQIQSYNARDLKAFANMLLEKHQGENILVVGHSNTTPDLLNFLMKEKVVDFIDESDYTNLFVVNIFKDKKRKAVLLKF